MPISQVADLLYVEKEKEEDFPRYFRLKRMFNNKNIEKNEKKNQFYTGTKSLSGDYN